MQHYINELRYIIGKTPHSTFDAKRSDMLSLDVK